MSPMEAKLPNFSLNRKITVLMALLTVVVLGAVAAINIPLELFPSGMVAPNMVVWVPWRDAPAPEVVDKIIIPLEEEISTVSGLDTMFASAGAGRGRMYLRFKHGTDLDVAYREVRDRVERARASMPDDVERVIIWKQDASGIPIFMFAVTVDPGVTDPYSLIEDEMKLPVERIEGVAQVEIQGLIEKEILIELDRKRTAAAGLNIYQLAQELTADNFSMASGNVRHGDKKLLLRSVARYGSLQELESRLVAPNVRLGDIARVHYDQPERDFRLRLRGEPAVAIQVMKESQANTMEVTRRLAEVVESFEDNPRLAGFGVEPFFNQGDMIMESLNTLLGSGRIGGIIAMVVLFFFLRRIRMTLIATLSIPLSIVIGLTAMYFLGETLNVLTLLALMISVGLLVDNSVVVAENIFRLHRDGVPKRQACVRGAGEIALAVTMATLTTIIVFLPVSLVDGQGQFFLMRLSIPISVSLLGSLLVALVMIPLAVYVTLPEDGKREKRSHVSEATAKAYEATFGRLNRWYTRVLKVALNRRLDLALVVVLCFAVTMVLMQQSVKVVEVQEEDRGGFEIDFRLPNNTTLEEAEAFFQETDVVLESLREELDLDGWYHFHRTAWGEIEGWFNSPRTKGKKGITSRQAAERVVEALPKKAGIKIFVNDEEGSGDENAIKSHSFFLEGEDPDILEQTALALEDLLAKVDGVIGLKKINDDSPSEMALQLDRERMRAQEINPRVAAAVVGYALRGQTLPRFHYEGREIPVTVRFQEEDRDSLDELGDFAVVNEQGEEVLLSSISDPKYLASAMWIGRRNKRMSREVTVEMAEGEEDQTRARLMALASGIDLPEGVTWGGGFRRGGGGGDTQKMMLAAGLSVVFIYLLMGFLFESSILPLSIVLTIPLAGMGVVWTHLIFGMDIDLLGVIGLILLIGVVVNNGIVLVDYITRLRNEGMERNRAVVVATERRFRPIMMTALTTIGGLIPLTLASTSSMGIGYRSFGLTLIGGLSTATLLTLLVVPVFYTLFDDARLRVSSMVRRGLRSFADRGGEQAAAPVES